MLAHVFVSLAIARPCTNDSLLEAVDRAILTALEPDAAAGAFETAATRANAALSCLDERISPNAAARYHFLNAIRGFINDDTAQVDDSLFSAVVAWPKFGLDPNVWPLGHPIWDAVAQARQRGAKRDAKRIPAVGWQTRLYFDGTALPRRQAPVRPTIVQRMTRQEWTTSYLPMGSSIEDVGLDLMDRGLRIHLATGAAVSVGEPLDDGTRAQPAAQALVPLELGIGLDGRRSWIRGQAAFGALLSGQFLYTGLDDAIRASQVAGTLALAAGTRVSRRTRVGVLGGAQLPSRAVARLLIGTDLGRRGVIELRPGVNFTTAMTFEPAMALLAGFIIR
ncbi:MAG: hypothetical protein AAGA48_14255 [Myxococcota bacterium]